MALAPIAEIIKHPSIPRPHAMGGAGGKGLGGALLAPNEVALPAPR